MVAALMAISTAIAAIETQRRCAIESSHHTRPPLVSESRDPMGHKRHRVALALAAVAAVYIVLAFRILSLDAVYSVDIAVKYAQAQSLADHHFRSLEIPYRASAIDP